MSDLKGIGDFVASFKGDKPGHKFHGNQYEGGAGGASEGGASGGGWSEDSIFHTNKKVVGDKAATIKKQHESLGGKYELETRQNKTLYVNPTGKREFDSLDDAKREADKFLSGNNDYMPHQDYLNILRGASEIKPISELVENYRREKITKQ